MPVAPPIASRHWAKFLLFLGLILPGIAQTKKAVLIGINCYNPAFAGCAMLRSAPESNTVARKPTVSGDWRYWSYDNLEGALNDVAMMKGILNNHGFETPDDAILLDEKATADRILATLHKYLIEDAAKDDLRVVYYSGHGNIVLNLGSKEIDGLDQTIVPSDHWRGTPDIRDKELSEIFWQAGSKGVRVVFIADSCHSASLTRGQLSRAKTSRDAGLKSPRDPNAPVVDDAADPDHDPAKAGVIELAAARRDQSAFETEGRSESLLDTSSGKHGAFTWALKLAIEKAPFAPMDEVFGKASAFLALDKPNQTPVLDGRNHVGIGIFGEPADSVRTQRAIVDRVDANGEITLRAGTSVGIYSGTELKRVSANNDTARITVVAEGIAISKAKLIAAPASAAASAAVKPGDVFEIDRWSVPPTAMLSIFIPPAAPADLIRQTAGEIGKLAADSSIEWIADESLRAPTHQVFWNGQTWMLAEMPVPGKRVTPPPVDLGKNPSVAAVRQLLPEKSKFLLTLPPTDDLVAAIPAGADFKRITRARTATGANYVLDGRVSHDALEYSWIRQGSMGDGPTRVFLPPGSDWIALDPSPDGAKSASARLSDLAYRLGRLREWQLLESPGSAKTEFPYHLVFRDDAGNPVTSGVVYGGHGYKMFLQLDRAALASLAKPLSSHWIYIFSIDEHGKGSLLHPDPDRGNQDNYLPLFPEGSSHRDPPALIPLTGSKHDIEVDKNYGTDTVFVIATEQRIDDPNIFEFEGVRSEAPAARGAGNPLEQLLSEMGTLTRSAARRVSGNWTLERMYLKSQAPQ